MKALLSGGIKGHFGQWAEDVLVKKLFPRHMRQGIYLDIGAYHPYVHSNTAFLWLSGWRGFNIDANPHSVSLFRKARPQDVNIWKAIIPDEQYRSGTTSLPLHLPDKPDLKSGVAATGAINQAVADQRRFSRAVDVPAQSIGALVAEHAIGKVDYLNIDIEGHDLAILSELDFTLLQPKVVSIEDFSTDFADPNGSPIARMLHDRAYTLAGRAGPTSIFLRTG